MEVLDLPMQHRLTLPIEWKEDADVRVFRTANSAVMGTVGWNPYIASVQLTWKLKPEELEEWLPLIRGPLKRFKYECPEKGWVVLRAGPSPITYAEWPMSTECSVSFERLK